jgi:hypothetical protein
LTVLDATRATAGSSASRSKRSSAFPGRAIALGMERAWQGYLIARFSRLIYVPETGSAR